MPGVMIHLATARAFDADGDGMFFVGNLAPDYTDERTIKSAIHLRDTDDRGAAMCALRDRVNKENAFELGWLLHLFADWRWDESVVPAFEKSYMGEGHWFYAYRSELGKLSHSMYHNESWRRDIWARVENTEVQNSLMDMRRVSQVLPVPLELGWYCDRVVRVHERYKDASPELFTAQMALDFAAETAELFMDWL